MKLYGNIILDDLGFGELENLIPFFLKVKDIYIFFGIKLLQHNIAKDHICYENNIDYIYLSTDYSPKIMFFIYTGLLRSLYIYYTHVSNINTLYNI
jgi:hypothetical protein